MTFRIEGLPQTRFAPLFDLSERELARRQMKRVVADSDRGFPCRISLEDAKAGEELILLNHVSYDVPTPFRTSYAIFVRQAARQAPAHIDVLPLILSGRSLGLRGFDADGMLKDAKLAFPGEVEKQIRALFANPDVRTIHAHNAAHGCFLVRIERDGTGDVA